MPAGIGVRRNWMNEDDISTDTAVSSRRMDRAVNAANTSLAGARVTSWQRY